MAGKMQKCRIWTYDSMGCGWGVIEWTWYTSCEFVFLINTLTTLTTYTISRVLRNLTMSLFRVLQNLVKISLQKIMTHRKFVPGKSWSLERFESLSRRKILRQVRLVLIIWKCESYIFKYWALFKSFWADDRMILTCDFCSRIFKKKI